MKWYRTLKYNVTHFKVNYMSCMLSGVCHSSTHFKLKLCAFFAVMQRSVVKLIQYVSIVTCIYCMLPGLSELPANFQSKCVSSNCVMSALLLSLFDMIHNTTYIHITCVENHCRSAYQDCIIRSDVNLCVHNGIAWRLIRSNAICLRSSKNRHNSPDKIYIQVLRVYLILLIRF